MTNFMKDTTKFYGIYRLIRRKWLLQEVTTSERTACFSAYALSQSTCSHVSVDIISIDDFGTHVLNNVKTFDPYEGK